MYEKMKNAVQKNMKSIVIKTIEYGSLWITYSSILIAILSYMLLFYAGVFTFIFNFWYVSWILMDPRVLKEGPFTIWLNKYIDFSSFNESSIVKTIFDNIVILEITIFLFGIILLAISLMQLINGIKCREGIYRGGIYRYIRHPQNLALIIMVLPFVGYVPSNLIPWSADQGIRFADLLSWIQFTILVIIYSDVEDLRLKNKYPDDISSYYENTGFMFPKIFSLNLYEPFSKLFYVFRYSVLLIVYILSIIVVRWSYEVLPVTGGWF